MEAVFAVAKGSAVLRKTSVPTIRDHFILVKVKAVALNPTDFKQVDNGFSVGAKVGCDYSGVVEQVGNYVVKFKPGDRVAGFAHGCNEVDHDTGAFAEYIIAKASVQMHIPGHLGFQEASTLGVSTVTVGLGLYMSLGLPKPSPGASNNGTVLIYGGSTATGMYGIQYAKASGCTVIATSSPHNFELLKSLGADAVFDYRSDNCASDIQTYTNGELHRSWDCTGDGIEVCAKAMEQSSKSVYGTIDPDYDEARFKSVNPQAEGPKVIIGYDGLGGAYKFVGAPRPFKQRESEYATSFSETAEELLRSKIIRPIPIDVNSSGSGLEGAIAGLDKLRKGEVSGKKLVYTVE